MTALARVADRVVNPSSHALARRLKFDFVGELASTIESLAISLGEAAYRESDVGCLVAARQIRATLLDLIAVAKELAEGEGK
jgi:hypothetical protein